MDRSNKFLKILKSRYLITGEICVLLWGITVVLWSSQSIGAPIVMLLCSYFGWKALNKIQPTMFLWMPLMGWLVYFLIKFFLSAAVGLFVAPFVIGKFIGTKLYERIGES